MPFDALEVGLSTPEGDPAGEEGSCAACVPLCEDSAFLCVPCVALLWVSCVALLCVDSAGFCVSCAAPFCVSCAICIIFCAASFAMGLRDGGTGGLLVEGDGGRGVKGRVVMLFKYAVLGMLMWDSSSSVKSITALAG